MPILFPNSSINCDEVLYLLPAPIEALQTMKAVLKPDGIIRANLHNVIQRQHFYRAQKMFELMGLFHENADETEEALVRETMNAIPSWVDLKAKTWTPDATSEVTNQVIWMNVFAARRQRLYRCGFIRYARSRRTELD